MPGGIRFSLEGDARLIGKLAGLNEIAAREARRRLDRCVDHVENTAKEGIANPPKTGIVYTQRFATSSFGGVFAYGSRPAHQASAPGEYPASDTGNLMRTIHGEVLEGLANLGSADMETQLSFNLDDLVADANKISGVVAADAEYAAPLEYKPPERGGRPFMRRALAESRDYIHQEFLGMRGVFGAGS